MRRRDFLSATGAAGLSAAAASMLPGCASMGWCRARQGGGRRRRLRRRDRGEVHPDVERRRDRRDARRARRVVHLVPAVEPRARRQQDARRHHGELRRSRREPRREALRDTATAVDPERRIVKLASGQELAYDRLVLSPGIDILWDKVPSLAAPTRRRRSCTHGRPDRRRSRCATSLRRCPTAAFSRSRFLSRRTGARRARTSARARSPGTSSARSRDPRC